jgi:hypothetical protein
MVNLVELHEGEQLYLRAWDQVLHSWRDLGLQRCVPETKFWLGNIHALANAFSAVSCFGNWLWRSKWTPTLMRLDSLFPPRKVLQLILRNQIKLPYEFRRENAAKKSTRCCHFRDLGKFRRTKTALHLNLGHCLSHLGVESGLGPKIKFVVLHSNLNFIKGQSFITGTKIIVSS